MPVPLSPSLIPSPSLSYLPQLQNPSNSPETFPEASVFLGPMVGDSAQQDGKQDGVGVVRREQTSQQPVPVPSGSGRTNGAALPPSHLQPLQAIVPLL